MIKILIADDHAIVSTGLAQILLEGFPGAVFREASNPHEVLRMISLGNTVTQIAESLTLSSKTVSTYRLRILKKLELSTTAELIRYAMEHNCLH